MVTERSGSSASTLPAPCLIFPSCKATLGYSHHATRVGSGEERRMLCASSVPGKSWLRMGLGHPEPKGNCWASEQGPFESHGPCSQQGWASILTALWGHPQALSPPSKGMGSKTSDIPSQPPAALGTSQWLAQQINTCRWPPAMAWHPLAMAWHPLAKAQCWLQGEVRLPTTAACLPACSLLFHLHMSLPPSSATTVNVSSLGSKNNPLEEDSCS